MNLGIISLITLIVFTILLLIVLVGHKHNGANWGHPATNILDGWIRLYCKRFHRQGNQTIEIPEGAPLILAANHLSAIDPFLLIAATDRPIRFMIAKEEYDKPILKYMFRAAGCIPVDRGGRVEGAFRTALRAIKAGELVALFPQGGIHSEATPRKIIKPGIIKLSELSQCSILPVRIRGISAPGTMVKCLYRRSRIEIDVAKLVPYNEVSSSEFRTEISRWLLNEQIELGCPN
ncbi:MAG: 1-acyl-sn-glycerol-3-phosphate acyltransferase [Kangiellaceae bacterium]|nr:1-acyl-sn-glycerol-3-phosphate acyltransferase [Kangiellaceae bacterium]